MATIASPAFRGARGSGLLPWRRRRV